MSATLTVRAKEKPRWYQLRWRLSNLVMRLARWIYPENPEVMAFYMQATTDCMIYGAAHVKHSWDDKEQNMRLDLVQPFSEEKE